MVRRRPPRVLVRLALALLLLGGAESQSAGVPPPPPPAQQLVEVRLPADVTPGQQLSFHAPDGSGPFSLRVPEGATAGQTLSVRVPAKAPPADGESLGDGDESGAPAAAADNEAAQTKARAGAEALEKLLAQQQTAGKAAKVAEQAAAAKAKTDAAAKAQQEKEQQEAAAAKAKADEEAAAATKSRADRAATEKAAVEKAAAEKAAADKVAAEMAAAEKAATAKATADAAVKAQQQKEEQEAAAQAKVQADAAAAEKVRADIVAAERAAEEAATAQLLADQAAAASATLPNKAEPAASGTQAKDSTAATEATGATTEQAKTDQAKPREPPRPTVPAPAPAPVPASAPAPTTKRARQKESRPAAVTSPPLDYLPAGVFRSLEAGLLASNSSSNKPALLLLYRLDRHVAGSVQSSTRWFKAFQNENWAPEAVLIALNVSEASHVFAEDAFATPEPAWLTQARAVVRGNDAFVGGQGAVDGAPEYWPRAYIYDPRRGGWQTGLVSADAARTRHFPFPLLARSQLQRHLAASLRCDAGHSKACRAPEASFGEHHHAEAETEKTRRRDKMEKAGRKRFQRPAGLSRFAEVDDGELFHDDL